MSRFGARTRPYPYIQGWAGSRSIIKSIQTGTISTGAANSATATINSVSVSSSYVAFIGVTQSENDSSACVTVTLTNATTVTGARQNAEGGGCNITYIVIEYFPGRIRSLQDGTTLMSGVDTNTSTITAVNTNKAQLVYRGTNFDTAGTTTNAQARVRIILTNTTTVTAVRGNSTNALTAAWTVVEFY